MIRRNEFNKILQLIDAGVLISDQEVINHINGLPLIIDNEIFSYEFNSNKITNRLASIDVYIEELDAYIQHLNNLSNLRVSKNQIRVWWELSFIGLNVVIEDVSIDAFDIGANSLKTIEEINSMLSVEFQSIKDYIQNPDVVPTTSKLKFNQGNFPKFKTLLGAEYQEFIRSSDWNFEYQFKLNYSKTPVGVA